jgi:hypothetical protein
VIEFFSSVLPERGPFCVALRNPAKKGFIHKAVSDFQSAAKIAAWGVHKGFDAYFCISSLKAAQWIDDKGEPHVRKKENVAQTKVFVLDVDIHPESPKKYNSKTDALEAIEKFNTTLNLPRPTIVDSGYGFHVYWHLEAPVKSTKWELIAQYFKAIAVHTDAKLAADTSRIADSAGVLRIPSTFNFKDKAAPQQVKIIQQSTETISIKDFGDRIRTKAKEVGIPFKGYKKPKKKNFAVDLGMDTPHDMRLVAKRCNQVKSYLHNIKIASEPLWYAMLGLFKHLYHPDMTMEQMIHLISRSHPGYSKDETDAKYEQVRTAQSGPTFCKKFAEINPQGCVGCPWATIVTTPAMLDMVDLPDPEPLKIQAEFSDIDGNAVVASVAAVPMPKPYFRGREGGIYMNLSGGSIEGKQDDETAVKKIYEYDLFPVARLQDETTGEEEIEVHLHLPKDGKRIIRVPNEVVIEPKTFASYLTARGVLLKPHEVIPLVSYMVDYTREIQKAGAAQGVYNRFGWRNAQEENASFILGDGMITADGNFQSCMTANWLVEQKDSASAKGSLKKWKEAFNVVRTHSPMQYQIACMFAFASPLFALTPYHGMIYNILGRGGAGKSTALKFMTSVFGKPKFTHILKKDNSIPVFNKLGYLNSITVAYDEITDLPPDQTGDLAYSISEGRGKERADRSGQTRTNFIKWDTCIVSCSNLSLYDKIGAIKQGNIAPAYRILETTVEASEINIRNQSIIESAIRVLNDNYGIAGRVYMQYVMQHRREIIHRLIEIEQKIQKSFDLRSAERFWGAAYTACAVGAEICAKLGLHQVNRNDILHWFYDDLQNSRRDLDDSQGNAMSIISDFMNTNLHATLFVNGSQINSYGMQNSPQREINIRLEKYSGKYVDGFISIPAFKKYCLYNKIEYGWVLKELIDLGAVKKGVTTKRIGAGTEFSGGPIGVINLNFRSSRWADEISIEDIERKAKEIKNVPNSNND